ncbi:MAG: sel1 repeat family protein, partial [gamma proteobacterium symbiont of Ctena orbiculata]
MAQPRRDGNTSPIRHRAAGLLCLLLILSPLLLQASTHEEAEAAIRLRNFSKAAEIYQDLAKQGDQEAQFALGGLYRSGRGVEKDPAKAYHWFLQAANQEHVEAQYTTGTMYEHGWGVKADLTLAT